MDKAKYYHPDEYPLTETKSFEMLYEGKGVLATDDGGFLILAGAAWGGGSAVNWSASLALPEITRKEWAEKHGVTHVNTDAYEKALDSVKEKLGVSTHAIQHNKTNQTMIDGCNKLGIHITDIPQNTAGHTHSCGWCTFGCPYGEKQSSLLTCIKEACAHGAHLLEEAQALQIVHQNGVVKGVEVLVQNKYRTFVKAKRVVVSCGSVQSPALMLRSKIPNKNIGKGLWLHPVSTVMGIFPETRKDPHHGSIMTALSNENANLDGQGYGIRIEVPATHPALFGIQTPWHSALDHKKRLIEYPYSSSLIILTRDKDSVGEVTINSEGNPLVYFQIGKQDAQHMLTGIETCIKILLAAGAQKVRTAQYGILEFTRPSASLEETLKSKEFASFIDKVRQVGIVQTKSTMFTAHQMGTCRMGANPTTAVVKPTGESWNIAGLYVADASVFPTASGVK